MASDKIKRLRHKLVISIGICLASSQGMSRDTSKSLISKLNQQEPLKRRGFDVPHKPQELIVKLKPSFRTQGLKWIENEFGGRLRHMYRASGAYLIELPQTLRADFVSQIMASHPDVIYVESNQIITLSTEPSRPVTSQSGFLKLVPLDAPNDPKFQSLWGLHNTGTDGGVADADIDAFEAWSVSTGSQKILTAVIDTGIDYTHPDLAKNYWNNPGELGLDAQGKDKQANGIDDDKNGFIDDFRGWDFANNDNDPKDDQEHGTHCAGTIGAIGNNNLGVVGVNWNTSLVGLKFLDNTGSGTLDHAVQAIEYATSLGVDLTSNSWGGGGFSETMFAAIQEASEKGIMFIAAAGNDGQNNDLSPSYPASYASPNIISVAAIDRKDKLAIFSNFGAKTVHVGAPGVDILSTLPKEGYGTMSGTSMATPHVAGVTALIKSQFPDLSMTQLKNRILFSSVLTGATALKTTSGGRLNALNGLKDDQTPPAKIENLKLKSIGLNHIEVTFNAGGDDGLEGKARAYEVKYSDTPIQTEAQWHDATTVIQGGTTPLAPSTLLDSNQLVQQIDTITAKIGGLKFESKGYVAARAFDSVGNPGEFSESLNFELPKLYNFFVNNAKSLTGVKTEAPWALETGTDGPAGSDGSFFSDSPGKDYKPNQKIAITFDSIPLPNQEQEQEQVFLRLTAMASLEENFDFVYTEISIDEGATWKRAGAITGRYSWTDFVYDITSLVGTSKQALVRLRLETDSSVNDDGIKVDQISLFTKAPVGP